jgi:hypothetical protein
MYNIESEFQQFMKTVAADVSTDSVQYKESRRVWFAATLRLLMHLTITVADLPEDEGIDILEDLTSQCNEFKEKLASGRA